MSDPTEAAYEAARVAFQAPGGTLQDAIRATVDTVWPLAVAEERRQAAADIREVCREDIQRLVDHGLGDGEFVKTHAMSMDKAARIAEGGPDHA